MTKNSAHVGALLLSFASLAAGCGEPAPDQQPAEAGQARSTLTREARLGLKRVSHGDGTYSYKLPDALRTPAQQQRGGLLWRYDGQARFQERPTRAQAQMVYSGGHKRPSFAQDPGGYFAGTVSVDKYGRRWVVAGVDQEAVAARVADYDRRVAETEGLEPGLSAEASPPSAEEPAGWALWRPFGWVTDDCNNDGDDDLFRYDADDRSVVSNPMTDRQKKVLLLSTPVGTCSGTMVDTEWLLTAAHCVTDSNGNAYNANTFDACTLGNYQAGAQCFAADDVHVGPGYNGSGMDDDYAVVHLTGQPGVGWMAISQASDGTIKADPGRNVGYPGRKPNCTSNSTAAINAGFPALTGYFSSGDVTSLSSTRIKTNVDLSGGHSGGPFYYCPSGCSAGAAHYLTGVVSGFHSDPLDKYTGGAKGPAIRTWVINNTP